LRASGRGVLFFTNNPTSDAAAYAAKLKKLGIDAAPGDVLTAGAATIRYLLDETPYRNIYALAAPSYEAELRAAGLTLGAHAPEAVLLSFDTSLTYEKLVRAVDLLHAGLPYIATNPDKVCPTANGSIPDCGAIAALLEAATGRTPKYIGKPHAEMVRMGLARLGAEPHETAMVGDRLYTDIAMARDSGVTGILVLSGETKRADLAGADYQPDFVFASVAALHAALRGA
jgi:HAD superfamily hydrolase (TIGR01450 family)